MANARFNFHDLQRGNISKERFDEVVKIVNLKIDDNVEDRQAIFRLVNNLYRNLEKELMFKRKEKDEPNVLDSNNQDVIISKDLLDKINYDENFNKVSWVIKVIQANNKLLEAESLIEHQRHLNARKALLKKMEHLRRERAEKLMRDFHYYDQLMELKKQYIQSMLAQRATLKSEISELKTQRNELISTLAEIEKTRNASREFHVNEIASALKEIKVEGIDLTDKQELNIARGHVVIEEVKRNEIKRINEKYATKLPPHGTLTGFARDKVERQKRAEIERVEKKAEKKLKEVLKANGFEDANSMQMDEYAAKLLSNQKILQNLAAHSKVCDDCDSKKKEVLESIENLDNSIQSKLKEHENLNKELQSELGNDDNLLREFRDVAEVSDILKDGEQNINDLVSSLPNEGDFSLDNMDLDKLDLNDLNLDGVSLDDLELDGGEISVNKGKGPDAKSSPLRGAI